ncbi:MAG: hypothetical protein ACFB14_26360 [Leptolyngbyaceae cyanobacterium]
MLTHFNASTQLRSQNWLECFTCIQPFLPDIVIELSELPKDYQRYILDDDHQPVVCEDEIVWREFMSKPENVLVAQDSIGKYTVVTVFLGFNRFNVEQPVFFQTTVFGADEHSHRDAATWEQAEDNHRGNVKVTKMMADYQADLAAGKKRKSFKPIECKVLYDELHFVLESEKAAIEALPVNKRRWERRGNVIVFIVGERGKAPDN